MAFADAVQRMLDAHYRTMGVDVVWTPVGGAPLALKALGNLGDDTPDVTGFGALNTAADTLRVRISEIEALAPGVTPQQGDAIAIGVDAFRINAAPRQRRPRRLEWVLELGAA